jgi:hypothetical protein
MNFRYIAEPESDVDGNLSAVIGSYTNTDKYEYILELDDNDNIIGGEWVGESKKLHPDFLWYSVKSNQNTIISGIEWNDVKMLLEKSLEPADQNEDDDSEENNDSDDDSENSESDSTTDEEENPDTDTDSETTDNNTSNGTISEMRSGNVAKDAMKIFGPFTTLKTIEVKMSGTGDADLFLKKGSQPTDSSFDCKSENNDSNELCSVNSAGSFFIGVKGYAASSDFTITVTYDTNSMLESGASFKTLSESRNTLAKGTWKHYGPFMSASSIFSAKMTGINDGDLYVRKGAAPTETEFDCRPYQGHANEDCQIMGPGLIYVSVKGESDSSVEYTIDFNYFTTNQ